MHADTPPAGDFLDFPADVRRVYALGLTYACHLRETGERPGAPAVFAKQCRPLPQDRTAIAMPAPDALADVLAGLDPALASCLTRQSVPFPALLDYEVEIGVVLFEDVDAHRLGDPAFQPEVGYVVANDLSARGIQIAGEGAADKLRFWSAAKSFPDFLPTGGKMWRPAKPDAGMLPALTLETRVNGELRQSASTGGCLYSVRQMLLYAARQAPDERLCRHDLVLTGTPAGGAWQRCFPEECASGPPSTPASAIPFS